MLDEVYALVRAGGIEQDGHNVMLYRDLHDECVDVEAGVDVAGPFASTCGTALGVRRLRG
jgi:hypothetical protein